jgi:hypothetical protein
MICCVSCSVIQIPEQGGLLTVSYFHVKLSKTRMSKLTKANRNECTKNSFWRMRNAKELAKVAETFVAFLTSETKDEITKSEMAKQAAIAMFQRVPNGYLTKNQIEPINHPLAEILIKRK